MPIIHKNIFYVYEPSFFNQQLDIPVLLYKSMPCNILFYFHSGIEDGCRIFGPSLRTGRRKLTGNSNGVDVGDGDGNSQINGDGDADGQVQCHHHLHPQADAWVGLMKEADDGDGSLSYEEFIAMVKTAQKK